MERAFYVLAYDCADDRRRAKIAKLMESLGDRVQGSVFEAYLTQAELEKIVKKSKMVLELKEDGLRIYCLCAECRPKVRVIGRGRVTPPPGTLVI